MSRLLKGLMFGMLLYLLYLLFEKQIQLFIVQNNLEILVSFLKFAFLYVAMVCTTIFIADKIKW